MTSADQTIRELLAFPFVLWAISRVFAERQTATLFTFKPPSPSALDHLAQELGAIGQAAWYRQQEAESSVGDS